MPREDNTFRPIGTSDLQMKAVAAARQPSLSVYHVEDCVFSSNGKWLHPLFELEQALPSIPYPVSALKVHDKIVGAAAAFLMAFLGIRHLHARILSQPAETVLKRFGFTYQFDQRVERIACTTESLLSPDMDIQEAVNILRTRAGSKIVMRHGDPECRG